MQVKTTETQERQNSSTPRVTQESSNGGTATLVDNRPSTVYQRKLQEAMTVQRSTTSPLSQPRTPQGSSRFQQIATAMGASYGVDTAGLVATHNSSFPGSLNAEATIQGHHIHFAPGMDTDYNIKHEVAHAIDNTLHGTPKGDAVVQGQRVDTTRETAVDRMATAASLHFVPSAIAQTAASNYQGQQTYSSNLQMKSSEPASPTSVVQCQLRPPIFANNWQTNMSNSLNRARGNLGGGNNFLNNETQTHLGLIERKFTSPNAQQEIIQAYNDAIAYINADPATGQPVINAVSTNPNYDLQVIIIGQGDTRFIMPTPDAYSAGTLNLLQVEWNPLQTLAVWAGGTAAQPQQVGIMSSAAILLHELGHAKQFIDDPLGTLFIAGAHYGNITNPNLPIGEVQYPPNQNHPLITHNIARQVRDFFNVTGSIDITRGAGNVPMAELEYHNLALHEYPFNRAKNEPLRNLYNNVYDPFSAAAQQASPSISQAFDAHFQAQNRMQHRLGHVGGRLQHHVVGHLTQAAPPTNAQLPILQIGGAAYPLTLGDIIATPELVLGRAQSMILSILVKVLPYPAQPVQGNPLRTVSTQDCYLLRDLFTLINNYCQAVNYATNNFPGKTIIVAHATIIQNCLRPHLATFNANLLTPLIQNFRNLP